MIRLFGIRPASLLLAVALCISGPTIAARAQTTYSVFAQGTLSFGCDPPALGAVIYAKKQIFYGFPLVSGAVRVFSLSGPYAMVLSASVVSADFTQPSYGEHLTQIRTSGYTHLDYRNWVPGFSGGIISFPAYAEIQIRTLQTAPGIARGSQVQIGFKVFDVTDPSNPALYIQSTQPPADGSPYSLGDPNLDYWLEPIWRGSATSQF